MTPGELWRRIVRLARGSRASDELREEMELHIALRARASRAAGVTDADAHHAARRRFGNAGVMREASRDQWGFGWAEHLMRDVRFAVRRLAQRPGFSLAVVGVLTLGIGATTAMFSIVNAAMLRPLPFADPARLVVLRDVSLPFDFGRGGDQGAAGPRGVNLMDVEELHGAFSDVAAYAAGGLNIVDANHPSRVKAGVVTTGFFSTLGVGPLRGRTFAAGEGVPGGANVVILSYGLWRGLFGGREVLGKRIMLSDQAYTVVGIMPRGFGFPAQSDLWIPMTVPNTWATFSAFRGFLPSYVIARLAPRVGTAAAAAQLLARWELNASAPSPNPSHSYKYLSETVTKLRATGPLLPLQRELVGDRHLALLVVFGATLMLLLVTCANVTILMLSQGAARRHEIAVRRVLGASRGRVAVQLLIESTVLAVTGAAMGVALAPAALGAMRALVPAQLDGVAPATIDTRVLAFAAGLALLAGIGFGLWPALGTTGSGPAETLKSGGRSATGYGAAGARRALVGAELAFTVVLLVGSLLMLRSFERLMSLDMGMRTDRVGTLGLAFAATGGDRAASLQSIDAIVDRLEATPGVAAAGVVNDLPLGGSGGISVRITPDVAQPAGTDAAGGRYLMASGGYFATMGIQLERGRTFRAADDSLAPPVAVISDAMARRFWPGVDAVGRSFTMAAGTSPITIVGVVADVRELGLEMDPMPQMYFPVAEHTPSYVAIVARATLEPAALLARMREAVRAVDPSQAVFNVRMMDDVVGASVATRRTNTLLIAAFAALALLLSVVGIYAVVSYGVSQRAREFGIRAACGARGGDLTRLVAGEMTVAGAIGLAAGIVAAWALSRVLTSMVYDVSVHDPWTFAAAPLVLAVPAVLAALVPARRAGRVNPVDVMRAD